MFVCMTQLILFIAFVVKVSFKGVHVYAMNNNTCNNN